ncbi:uncharacterized protein CBL_01432 [Carabus blaptoides fortunei]
MLLQLAIFISGYFVVIKGCLPPEEIMLSFTDVSAKFPSGIMTGNLADLGSFDRCVALDQKHNGTRYKGKYCLVSLSLPSDLINIGSNINKCITDYKIISNETTSESRRCASLDKRNNASSNINLVLGWCVPDVCPIADVTDYIEEVIINLSIFPTKLKENITIEPFLGGFCQTIDQQNKDTWTIGELGAVVFFAIVGSIIVLSTSYDAYLYYKNKKSAHTILTAFSLKTNGEKFLASSSPKSDPLLCLCGIRYTRMVCVLFENRYALDRGEPFVYFSDLRNFQAENIYIMGADVNADTLFFITSLAVAYEFFNAMEQGIKFNVFKFWIRKYIKLAPLMAVVVLMYATILIRIGSGPIWPLVLNPMKENCQKYWWTSLLYIQNYYNIDNICVGQSWYNAVDNQMFFLSPLILVPLWKWPKYSLYAAFLIFIGSILSPFILSFYYVMPSPTHPDYSPKHYFPTHIRFGAYFMGLIFGYIMFRLKNQQYRLHPLIVTLAWTISFALLMVTVLSPHFVMYEHDRMFYAFYNGMRRQVWLIGVSWLIYACAHGYAGPINSFLTWSGFQSLGRLAYIMYAIHVAQQSLVTAERRTTIYYSDFHIFHIFCSDLVLTTTVAACLYLSFESPMTIIDKLIFEKEEPKKSQELAQPKNDEVVFTNGPDLYFTRI